jgi:hypothetical protein
MSKLTMAQRISVANCECCGGVHVELWRNGKLFAVAIPASVEAATALAADLQAAVKVMQDAGGKPHVH